VNTKTLVLLGAAAAAIYFFLQKKKISDGVKSGRIRMGMQRDPGLPGVIPVGGGLVISNTGGASQGTLLPNAADAQRESATWGYGSGS